MGDTRRVTGALRRAVGETLGLVQFPGAGRWTAMSVIDAAGTGLLAPITVLYFTVYVGLSATSVGTGLTVGALAALALAPVTGALVDRVGAKPVLMASMALASLAYASYGLVDSWATLVVAVAAAEIAAAGHSTGRKAMIANIASGRTRTRMLASQRSVRNIGYGIGGLLATLALALGGDAYLGVVYGDAASFLVAIALVAGIEVPPLVGYAARPGGAWRGLRTVAKDRRYLALTAAAVPGTFYIAALDIAMPLWIVRYTEAPAPVAGLLFAMNTVIVVAFQVRASRGIDGPQSASRAYRRAAALMGLCAAAFLAAHYVDRSAAILLLVLGALAHVGVEMFASAGEWVTSMELAPADHRGSYLSVFSLGNSLQDALGPTFVTVVLLLGAAWLWPTLAALVWAGTLASAAIASGSGRRPSRR
ncbi:MAG: MFS transporter [Solirubrobacterales bacterium]